MSRDKSRSALVNNAAKDDVVCVNPDGGATISLADLLANDLGSARIQVATTRDALPGG